jgi:hypothetical protein
MVSEYHQGPGLLLSYSAENFLHGLDAHGLETGTIYQVSFFKLRSPVELCSSTQEEYKTHSVG